MTFKDGVCKLEKIHLGKGEGCFGADCLQRIWVVFRPHPDEISERESCSKWYWLFKPLNSQFRVVLKLSLQLENSIQGWTNSNVVLHNRTRLGPDCGLPGHLRALHQQTSRRWAWQLWHRGEEGVGSQMQRKVIQKLGGGFKYFLFSPLFGEDSHVD